MSDVLVVGGGIVGLLGALELTRRGRKVTILDAPVPYPPASWAGGGILSPLYAWRYSDAMNRLSVDAFSRYQQILDECVAAEIPGCNAVLHGGGLWVKTAGEDAVRAHQWAERWRVPVRAMSAGNLMPGATVGAGFLFPSLGNIRNPSLLKILRTYLQKLEVRFELAEVNQVLPSVYGGRVVATDGRQWQSDTVVISAGHAAAELLSSMKTGLPLFPAKGEMLLYRMKPDKVPAVMLTERGYMIPRQDGSVLVGSTLRKGDNTTYPTVAGRYQLERLAAGLWPELASSTPAFHWAGVRPGCKRDIPFIGPVPGTHGIFAAVGHYRNGLVSAPASAELLAQLITGEQPFIDPEPYSLSLASPPSRSSSSFFNR
ncbi:FAD-dependent oxidoreductase [Alcanivorax sp.]|jgi:glycine oxidase|uniref:NAD(P)/FAD-dependent oxidoreductase n=1 Tax=Alcanivorax sp. TaxID=1872427 RepID=UPI0032D8E784